jgi:hypothetical protein
MKESRILITIFLVSALVFAGEAFASQGFIVGSQNICTQGNSTYIACYDGSPMNFSFQISAPYAVGYGPYIAYVYNKNVSEPFSLFGGSCSIPGGQTIECEVTVNPLPLSSGNGIIEKEIRLKLQSEPYPQLYFNKSINVTIYHYLTQNQSIFLKKYQSTFSEYQRENYTYGYFCYSYGICQENIGYGISVAGAYLGLASQNAALNEIESAMNNASIANSTLEALSVEYSLFLNNSNLIINNVIKGHYILAKTWNRFQPYSAKLYNCKTGNTTYGKNIFTQIGNAENYPMETNLNSSYKYISLANNVSNYTDNAISVCAGVSLPGSSSGAKAGFLSGLSNKDKYIILGLIIAAIVGIYLLLRFKNSKEVERIRKQIEDQAEEMHKEKKKEKSLSEEIPIPDNSDSSENSGEPTGSTEGSPLNDFGNVPEDSNQEGEAGDAAGNGLKPD